jgi:hypothetical protein
LISSGDAHRSLLRRAPDDWPIKKGYVAFGDSYGAGMGTGITTQDSCRVGSNNFADLLMRWTNNNAIDFQRGLNRQINEWVNPAKADVATVSIGGNDLKFSDLLWYCVASPNSFRTGAQNRQLCIETEAAARQQLDDNGDDGLRSKLVKAFKRILKKSGRDVSQGIRYPPAHFADQSCPGLSYLCHQLCTLFQRRQS